MMGSTRGVRAVQLATARLRSLPDFVIFGAAKGGTTALYEYLAAHPLVVGNQTKEIHFADRTANAGRGANWYRSWFPRTATLARAARHAGAERAWCGEATPNYLAVSGSAPRLAAVAPGVRLVALLREPGARAWSHYRMSRQGGGDPDEFASLIRDEAATQVDGHIELLTDYHAVRRHYLRQGHYADELGQWFDTFGREPILLLRSEELFGDPGPTFARICAHLGLPDPADYGSGPEFEVVNAGGGSTEMPPEIRQWLDEHFALPNQRLSALTDGAIAWP